MGEVWIYDQLKQYAMLKKEKLNNKFKNVNEVIGYVKCIMGDDYTEEKEELLLELLKSKNNCESEEEFLTKTTMNQLTYAVHLLRGGGAILKVVKRDLSKDKVVLSREEQVLESARSNMRLTNGEFKLIADNLSYTRRRLELIALRYSQFNEENGFEIGAVNNVFTQASGMVTTISDIEKEIESLRTHISLFVNAKE